MKTLKKGTKAYNNMITKIINAELNEKAYNLSTCYAKPSSAKRNIYLSLLEENKYMWHYITAYNKWFFTICFEYDTYYKVITKYNTYILEKKVFY